MQDNTVFQKVSTIFDKYMNKYTSIDKIHKAYEAMRSPLADFLNQELTEQKQPNSIEALEYMRKIETLCKKNNLAFHSFFQPWMFDLHKRASIGAECTRNAADVTLLSFFAVRSPDSVENKGLLLQKIAQMSNLKGKQGALIPVLFKLADNYDQNHQNLEDPDKSVLYSLKDAFEKLCKNPLRNSARIKQEKEALASCAKVIKKYAPESHKECWENYFKISLSKKIKCFNFKEPANVYDHPRFKGHIPFSRGWERD